MSRRRLAHEVKNYARSRRESALARAELRTESTEREAAGVTSFAVKKEDPGLRAMIDAAIAAKKEKTL